MSKYKIIETIDAFSDKFFVNNILFDVFDDEDSYIEVDTVDAIDMHKDDLKRFLCETFGLSYVSSTEEILDAINEKIK